MASLTYNSVFLSTIQTTGFMQEAVYDDSGSDYLYTKITLTVKGVFNRDAEPANPGEDPASEVVRLRRCLMEQCKPLLYESNGVALVTSPEPNKPEDVKHGPLPQHLNLVQITEGTILVEYSIVTHIIECCAGQSLPYISNRWSETDTIDQKFATKREIHGRIIFRADQINSKKFNNGQPADFYRNLVIPPSLPLLPNFIRTQQVYTVQEDGLALEYQITDEEQYCEPPDGMTSFTGSHTTTTSKGAVFKDSIEVEVEAPFTVPKSILILRCAQVINQQVSLSVNKALMVGVVKFDLHTNKASIRVETLIGAKEKTFGGLNIAMPDNAARLNYLNGDRRSNLVPDPGTRGTANLAMTVFDNYLKLCNPTQSQQTPYPTPLSPNTIGPQNSPGVITNTVDQLPPSQPTIFNQSKLQTGIYTQYICDIDYKQDDHKMQMAYMDTSLTACAIIPIAQGIMKKIVNFTAERWGLPPEVPTSVTTNTNNRFLSGGVTQTNVVPSADGQTLVYTARGRYEFAVIDPTQEPQIGGIAPYVQVDLNQTSTATYTNGLIDNSGQSQSQSGQF